MTQPLNVYTVDPFTDERWDAYVVSHPSGSAYHHSRWIRAMEQTYGYASYCFVCENGKGVIEGILPTAFVKSRWTGNRMISFPFSPFCGALIQHDVALNQLLSAAEEEAGILGADHMQLRWGVDPPIGLESYQRQNYHTMYMLDLRPGMENLFGSFHKSSIQRPIKKSLKIGLELNIGATKEYVEQFYDLQVQTRKRHGVPPQPFAYFENMHRAFEGTDILQVYSASFDNRVVAALLLLRFGDTVIYQNGGSNSRFLHLKPNHFLLWKAIEKAKEDGFSVFNFGTCTPEDEGLIRFKQQWGTEERQVPYFYFPGIAGPRNRLESSWKFRAATAILRHMPAAVLRRIGELTYKHAA